MGLLARPGRNGTDAAGRKRLLGSPSRSSRILRRPFLVLNAHLPCAWANVPAPVATVQAFWENAAVDHGTTTGEACATPDPPPQEAHALKRRRVFTIWRRPGGGHRRRGLAPEKVVIPNAVDIDPSTSAAQADRRPKAPRSRRCPWWSALSARSTPTRPLTACRRPARNSGRRPEVRLLLVGGPWDRP